MNPYPGGLPAYMQFKIRQVVAYHDPHARFSLGINDKISEKKLSFIQRQYHG